MTSVGVGTSRKRSAGEAGREAAIAARAALNGATPSLVMTFATVGYRQPALIAAIREIAGGEAVMAGCSGEGVIFDGGCDESPCAVTVMMFASQTMTAHAFNVGNLGADAAACGRAIADRVTELGPARAKAVLLFPDGVTGNSTQMLRALHAALPFPVPLVGGAAGDTFKVDAGHSSAAFQYCGTEVHSDSVTAVILGGAIEIGIEASHGCMPLGLAHTITRAEGGWVHEVDGRPAWHVFKEYLEGDPADLASADMVHLCVGESLPDDKRAIYGLDYVIRTPMRLSDDRKSLFFAGALPEGSQIQFTRRDAERVATSARATALRLAQRSTPAAVFQFDCAGRGHILFGDHAADVVVKPLQAALPGVPWAGFHSFGEIAPIGDTPYFHNYTVVLCAIYDV